MRRWSVGLVALGTLVAAVSAIGPSRADEGMGVSEVSTTIVGVELGSGGSTLGLRVLGEDVRSTNDTGNDTVYGRSEFRPVTVTSATVDQLDIGSPIVFASRTPGGRPSDGVATLDLSAPAEGVSVPPEVASGQVSLVNVTSTAAATTAGAGSSASASNLALAGDLVRLQAVSSGASTSAVGSGAQSTRWARASGVRLAPLGALLEGVGIELTELPVGIVADLIAGGGLSVPGLPSGADLDVYVAQLDAAAASVQATAAALSPLPLPPTTPLSSIIGADAALTARDQSVGAVLAPLGLGVPGLGGTLGDLSSLAGEVRAAAAQLLVDAVAALDQAPLLTFDAADLTIDALSTGQVATSLANVGITLGTVSVAGLAMGTVSLDDTVAQVSQLVTSVNTKLDEVLATVDPSLAGLLRVAFLTSTENVTATAIGSQSTAGFDLVTASITPPADLAAVIGRVASGDGIEDAITTYGGTVPEAAVAMDALSAALNGGVFRAAAVGTPAPLAGGATIRVLDIDADSSFTAAATTTTTTTTSSSTTGGSGGTGSSGSGGGGTGAGGTGTNGAATGSGAGTGSGSGLPGTSGVPAAPTSGIGSLPSGTSTQSVGGSPAPTSAPGATPDSDQPGSVGGPPNGSSRPDLPLTGGGHPAPLLALALLLIALGLGLETWPRLATRR